MKGRKRYKISNVNYPEEYLGEIELLFDEDTAIVYPLESYEGLHPDFCLPSWARKGLKEVKGRKVDEWLSCRVCPPGRHNISQVLEDIGLEKYSVTGILEYNKGACDFDDLYFQEIE